MIGLTSEAGVPRRYYGLGLLTLIYVSNFIDRQVINIVAEPIKHELQLTDGQLGLMTGLVFAIFYSALGIPIARAGERHDRRYILAACLAMWSGFTVVCGLARSFAFLLLGRMGVAVGEAGCAPTSQSLVVDYFPPHQRARALSILALGAPLGGLVGLLIGGLVTGTYGWRMAFFLAGVPGLLLVPFLLFTLHEPRRGAVTAPIGGSLGEAVAALRGLPSFWWITAGTALSAMFTLGEAAFLASFFLRLHTGEVAAVAASAGLPPIAFVGVALGLIMGIGGVAGSVLGGVAADRMGRSRTSGYLVPPTIAALLLIPVHVATLLAPSVWLAFACLFATAVLKSVNVGPTWAAIQTVVPAHMRGTAAAVQLMVNNLVGLGLGPIAVGFGSDWLAGSLGAGEGLRWSLLLLTTLLLPIALLFWRAQGAIARDLARESGPTRTA